MAGVCGIVDASCDQGGVHALLAPMVAAMPALGPDGLARHVADGVGLVQFLDYQTPESLTVTTPVRDEILDLTLVSDVRLDNREELAERLGLAPAELAAMSDEALLLAGFRRFGIDVVEQLLGDFFFALWEGRERRLWLARDPLGVRSGFYARRGRRFWFASELTQLLASRALPQRPNLTRIADFLGFSFSDHQATFYEDIVRLGPGSVLSLHGELATTRRYYALPFPPEHELKDNRAYGRAFRELLVDATRRRLRTRVPTGFLLSGGLDSSSLVGIAEHTGQLASQGPLRTFSATFPDYPEIDERDYIALVHASPGVDGARARDGLRFDARFVRVDRTSPFETLAETIARHGEPFYSPNFFVDTLLLDEAQRAGVRLILDGLDGDTTVGHGWEYMTELLRGGRVRRLYRLVRELSENTGRSSGWILWNHAAAPILEGAVSWATRGGPVRRPALMSPALAARVGWEERVLRRQPRVPPAFTSYREQHWRKLGDALLPMSIGIAGHLSSARGMGRRHPYLDRRLVEFCLALPAEQRLSRGADRVIQRRAVEGFTPEEIRRRLSKSVWLRNLSDRMQHDERAWIASWLTKTSADTPIAEFIDLPALKARCRLALEGRASERTLAELWVACALELWFARGRN